MRNAGLDELQAANKTGETYLQYVDDTPLMAESKEELKSLSMRLKEENERVSLKLNIKKTKIMASGPIYCMTNRGKGGSTDRFLLLRL